MLGVKAESTLHRIEHATPSIFVSLVLARWHTLDAESAAAAILPCCGSNAWADSLAAARPFPNEQSLLDASADIWFELPESDWQQAFDSHPRLGERKPRVAATTQSLAWSAAEQSTALAAEEEGKAALRAANLRYEQHFGRIFILCAQGRSTSEILAQLERRLGNTPGAELLEAAQQQALITELRLRRWLTGESGG